MGLLPQRGIGKESSWGEGNLEKGLTCLGSVAWHQGGEPLGQRVLKDRCGLGSFIDTALVLSIVSKCWVSFHRICKVGRLYTVKSMFAWTIFKAIRCVRI